MYLLGLPIVVGILGGIAFVFGGAAYWLRKWSLSPIAIPNDETYRALYLRERFLTLFLLCMFFLFSLWLISVAALLLIYAIGVCRHIKSRTNPPQGAFAKAPPVPIIPRFALSDLMAIVFSFGCAPAILLPMSWIRQAEQRAATVAVFVIAILTFPACFLCMLYRLECHRVPAGLPRLACVAFAPYVTLSCVSLLPLTIIALITAGFRSEDSIVLWIYLSISIVLLVAGRVLANMASNAAQPMTLPQPESNAQSETGI
jgi:hypothetical protein